MEFVQPEDDTNNTYTAPYEVVVTGLLDVATGKEAQINYTVNFVDYTASVDATVTKVGIENIKEYVVYNTLSDTESLKKIAALLPKIITVTADSKLTVTVPVKMECIIITISLH